MGKRPEPKKAYPLSLRIVKKAAGYAVLHPSELPKHRENLPDWAYLEYLRVYGNYSNLKEFQQAVTDFLKRETIPGLSLEDVGQLLGWAGPDRVLVGMIGCTVPDEQV